MFASDANEIISLLLVVQCALLQVFHNCFLCCEQKQMQRFALQRRELQNKGFKPRPHFLILGFKKWLEIMVFDDDFVIEEEARGKHEAVCHDRGVFHDEFELLLIVCNLAYSAKELNDLADLACDWDEVDALKKLDSLPEEHAGRAREFVERGWIETLLELRQ